MRTTPLLVTLLLLTQSALAQPYTLAGLRSLMFPSSADTACHVWSTQATDEFAQLLADVWHNEVTTSTYLRAGTLGLELRTVEIGAAAFWLVRDSPMARGGHGVYLVRRQPPPANPIMLQTPHAYDEAHVTYLVLAAMTSANPRLHAFFAATTSRYAHQVDDTDDDCDAARETALPFHQASMLAVAAGAGLVQLHGYDEHAAGREANVAAIVSAGRATGSSSASTHVASALSAFALEPVRRYPEDVGYLGATTNEQGKYAFLHGRTFVHIEMAKHTRDALRNSLAAAMALGSVLLSGEEASP